MPSPSVASEKRFPRAPVVVLVFLCLASLITEALMSQSEGALLQSHQARFDCLALESARVPRCKEEAKLHPIDADYCEEAVLACKAKGTYERASDSEHEYFTWGLIARSVRIVLAVFTISFLLWFALLRPLKRKRRSRARSVGAAQ